MKTHPKPLDVESMSFDKLTIVVEGSQPVNPEATLVALKSKPATRPVKK